MARAVFVRVAAPRTKSSLWSKSLSNLGSMAKIFLHALSILIKHMTEFLGIVSCYSPLSHSTADRRFAFGWMACNQSRSMWSLHSGNSAFCHLSFSLFTWIGSTNAAKPMCVPRLEIAKSVVCYSLMIWFCFLRQSLASSAHLIALQMHATPPV